MVDYKKKIPQVHEYQGEVFPSATFDPADSTLKDQILMLLVLADQRYAEVLDGADIEGNDPCYLLVDAVKILEGAISNLEASDLWTEKYGEIDRKRQNAQANKVMESRNTLTSKKET